MKIQELYEAIADEHRRKIIELLKQKDMNVGEIGKHFSISNSSLSHHLSKLKSAGLVVSQRQGQSIIYSLNTSSFEELVIQVNKLFSRE